MTQRVEVTYSIDDNRERQLERAQRKKEWPKTIACLSCCGAVSTLVGVVFHILGDDGLSHKAYDVAMLVGSFSVFLNCTSACFGICWLREYMTQGKQIDKITTASCTCIATICMLASAILILKGS